MLSILKHPILHLDRMRATHRSSSTMALRIASFAMKNKANLCIQRFASAQHVGASPPTISRCLPASIGLATPSPDRCLSAIPQPVPVGAAKEYPEKIYNIVSEISKLSLIEIADLNELLKKTLNIQDTPMMAMPVGAPAPVVAEEDDNKVQAVQTSFTVKLLKFDDTKKIALIKELKNVMEGMNLVQAKKFVEEAPKVVMADLSKDEAEKLKKTLEAAGGSCEIV
ncbi:39S ribosomal protein L12 [Tropilaelaps mercedesae]|uniref:39S ribosomal protein L12 n=1 Tax=Tropilaelaps mercedesae TaxID=418985 RepID=A0A1V9XQA5_9ACAR|nr:39S ribosomal protein L12 [Tropilaelaps mercedesae]